MIKLMIEKAKNVDFMGFVGFLQKICRVIYLHRRSWVNHIDQEK